MSKRTLPKKRFNVEEALALCMSDDEDIGAIGDSDSDSDSEFAEEGEYEEIDIGDAAAEPQQIAAQEAIHEDFQFHDFEIEAVAPVERPKKKRNDGPITSLDTALDESNFTPFDPQIPSPTLESEIDKVQYKWVVSTSLTSGRNNAANILPLPPGPKSGAKYKKVAVDIWSEFITSEIITTILMYTNGKIHRAIAELPDEMKNNDKYSHIKEVTETELLAFFGFYYARGLLGQNLVHLKQLYSQYGHPVYAAIMSYNRVLFINSMITFDDHESRSDRWKTDKFAAFRAVFEMFNKSCARNMSPDDFNAIDETLYPTRGGISFKTYNKDKPAKYGINFRSLGSSRRPYVFYTVPYAGKPEVITDQHIQDTATLVKRIVAGYERFGYTLRGTNIAMDRYYTSIPTAQWLFAKKITCIGTIQTNRKGIPAEMKEKKQREPNSWMSCKQEGGPVILNSYVVKTKSKGKKNVLLLQTTNAAHYKTSDEKAKPLVYKVYDYTKGGVDIPDQRMASYTTKPKTGKWTIVAMSYVLDMARMNSQTVYEANNSINGFNSFDFGWLLVNSLVAPHMHNRIEQGGLTMTLKSSMMKFMGEKEPESQPPPPNDNIPRRCKICLDKTHGVGHKVKKDSIGKVKSRCEGCGHPVCLKHTMKVCEVCSELSAREVAVVINSKK